MVKPAFQSSGRDGERRADLFGAIGDDGERPGTGDCQLQVETREGLLHFRLANHRLNANVMNKFHVNVPTASEPLGAAVICAAQTLVQRHISAPEADLSFTVNGRPLE